MNNLNSFSKVERELHNIRHALDHAAIVAITDAQGIITHVNDKFCEISKYSRQELLGQNHRLINSGLHQKSFFVEMWKTIASGKIWEGEICNRAKDGTFYWVHTTLVPFLNDQGKPDQYVSIRYEITQRKQAEQQLKIYAEKLEHSNRELQDFASIAAHDLQEPLRKIQAFGDRLNTKFRNQLGEEGSDFINRMLSSSKRMRKLIDDLLTYSRVSSKNEPFSNTDLNQVLADVLSDLEVRIEQVQATVSVAHLPIIQADASQMRQLFQNLIANALKFHQPKQTPQISINSVVNQNRCLITVADNGIGFEEKYAEKIFTIFQRLHGRFEYEGTGVGLAICRRIVERHGGILIAKSTPNQGSQFEIDLPLNANLG